MANKNKNEALVKALLNLTAPKIDNSKMANQLKGFPQGMGSKQGVYKLPADYNVKGPVDSIAEAAKAQYAKGALSGLLNNPKQSIGDAVKDVKNLFNPEYMKNVQGMSNQEVTNLALDANPVMGAITAWHGSPHLFDKFDLNKIENSASHGQSYGWGHYLSDKMDVGKGYQPRSDKLENAIGKLSEKSYNTDNYVAADIYDNFLLHRTPDEIAGIIKESGYKGKDLLNANKALQQGTNLYKKHSQGGLYKVDLPDEYLPKMLQWEKTLSEQHPDVQTALLPIIASTKKSFPNMDANPNASAIYQAYAQHRGGNPKVASQAMAEAGIPGIKYLDTFSGGAGSGANDYVIFNDNILKILERNSQPIK
jgi:hypothetical protein